jgi:broad specificity phosphatase PhoE
MKILLMRHGEAMDDVYNTFGGWADDPLSDKGRQQIRDKADSIKALNIKFDKIYTSPLKRANEIGTILAELIGVSDVEKIPYAIEYNGYGILSGLEKDGAYTKYPDQMELLNKTNEYLMDIENLLDSEKIKMPLVLGAESIYSFVQRVRLLLETIEASKEENIILVTHGGIIGFFFKLFLGQRLQKREDCGWILLEGSNGKYSIIDKNGIE